MSNKSMLEKINGLKERKQHATSLEEFEQLLQDARMLVREAMDSEFHQAAMDLFREIRDKSDEVSSYSRISERTNWQERIQRERGRLETGDLNEIYAGIEGLGQVLREMGSETNNRNLTSAFDALELASLNPKARNKLLTTLEASNVPRTDSRQRLVEKLQAASDNRTEGIPVHTDKQVGGDIDDLMTRARQLYYAGEYLDAINLFSEILNRDPNNHEANERLSAAEYNLMHGVVPDNRVPFNARLAFGQAQSLERAGRYSESQKKYGDALDKARKGGIQNWEPATEGMLRIQDYLMVLEIWTQVNKSIQEHEWVKAIEQLEVVVSLNPNDPKYKDLLELLRGHLDLPDKLSPLLSDAVDPKNHYKDFRSLEERLVADYKSAPDEMRQDLYRLLLETREQLALRISEKFYALVGRGGLCLDVEDYPPAIGYFMQAVDIVQACPGIIKQNDAEDAFAKHLLASSLQEELINLQNASREVQEALQGGDSCTAVDILLSVLQLSPRGKSAKSLAADMRKLKKKALILCAEKISTKGGYQRARSILEPYADDDEIRKSLEKITDRQNIEMTEKAQQKIDLMEDLKKQSRVWFTLGTIASAVGGMLLIGGAVGAFWGKVSSGILSSVSAILPAAFAALFYTQSDKLRKERTKIITKTTDEERLDIEAQRKAVGLLEINQKKPKDVETEDNPDRFIRS